MFSLNQRVKFIQEAVNEPGHFADLAGSGSPFLWASLFQIAPNFGGLTHPDLTRWNILR